ncbi:hypothetical protein ANCCEY_00900 [Ancylostoma ceylanicum]|uniref:Uncharacterized protein n=1 Tax=Ancylostoma ceylanicum TaxID=53326 RepID=A0A0D6MD56_9BILA|nr:hypothetical protein ANCCEY_00900 [Ancylostoma ceylanicum]
MTPTTSNLENESELWLKGHVHMLYPMRYARLVHAVPRAWSADFLRGESNTDTHIVGLFSIFVVPAVTFLIILPGVRKHRFTSTFSFLFNMCIGATLLVSLYHPCWHRAETPISTTYKAFSNAKMDAYILVRVGLQYLNISLSINKMEKELSNALVKGLPFPILKVIEYLSGDGFSWGRQYRVAGYYTACMLW